LVMAPSLPRLVLGEKSLPSDGVMFTFDMPELETLFPRHVLNAIEAISRQIETEIYKPLLQSENVKQLTKRFTQLFQRYSAFYTSLTFLMFSQIKNIDEFTHIWAPVTQRLSESLKRSGPEIIGEEATNNVLIASHVVNRVSKKLLNLAESNKLDVDSQEMAHLSIAYSLTTSCVYYYLINHQGNLENVEKLGFWCRYYAIRMYECAKLLRLVKVPSLEGPVPIPCEEDRLLSEAGLEDWAVYYKSDIDEP
jgi:hypothetical protein